MCAKWADNENKCENYVNTLLKPIGEQFFFDDSGSLSGSNYIAYEDYLSAIESYFSFAPEVPVIDRYNLLTEAVHSAAKAKDLKAKTVLRYLCIEEAKYLKKTKDSYEFITTLSIKYFKSLSIARLNPPIKFSLNLPKKIDIKPINLKFQQVYKGVIPENFTYVRIPTKARSANEAYKIGIDAIDLLRGIWNLKLNTSESLLVYSMNKNEPINSITLGPVQIILLPDGDINNIFWSEPEYTDKLGDIQDKWKELEVFEKKIRKKLSNHPYRNDIEESIRGFTRALDYKDLQVSFLQLWTVLEQLTAINDAKYDVLIKRVAFLYQDTDLTKAYMQHLRLYRNSSIHDGHRNDRVEKYLYQIKRHIQTVLRFHIFNPFKVKSMNDAAAFLDLPTNRTDLNARFINIKNALKFRTD